MEQKKVFIGNAGVDSGQLMIVDPCYVSGENEHLGVTSHTACGDGVFPVFQVFEGDALVGLYVDISLDAHPLAGKDGWVQLGNKVAGKNGWVQLGNKVAGKPRKKSARK